MTTSATVSVARSEALRPRSRGPPRRSNTRFRARVCDPKSRILAAPTRLEGNVRNRLLFKNCSRHRSSDSARSWRSSLRSLWSAVLLLPVIAACDGDGTDDGGLSSMDAAQADATTAGDAGPAGCSAHVECDDDVDCTEDTCTLATRVCRHAVVPALCPAGSSCHPARGCEMGRACATDADCADEDACTVNERCDPAARVCLVEPLDGDRDGDPPRSCGGTDCNDAERWAHPGAPELIDDLDNDCDGVVDEDISDVVIELCTRRMSCSSLSVADCYSSYARLIDYAACVNTDEITTALSDCARESSCDDLVGCSIAAFDVCTCASTWTRCPPPAPDHVVHCSVLAESRSDCGACAAVCPDDSRCIEGECHE